LSLLDATILLNSNYHPLPPLLLVMDLQTIVQPMDNAQLVLQIYLELYVEFKLPDLQLVVSQMHQHLPHLLLIIVVLVILI
jgi:hypothetical protein